MYEETVELTPEQIACFEAYGELDALAVKIAKGVYKAPATPD